MFLHPLGGLISRGPTAQTVNGDKIVRALVYHLVLFPLWGCDPVGSPSQPISRCMEDYVTVSWNDVGSPWARTRRSFSDTFGISHTHH